jgi:uncharacterized protein YodC (DUF2158 family)
MILGDVVVLRSGGPEMTVNRIRKAAFGRQLISCIWFVGGKKGEALFDLEVLKTDTSPAEPRLSTTQI